MPSSHVSTVHGPPPSGFVPRELNRFEESIGEAWIYDPLAVYIATVTWAELSARGSKFNRSDLGSAAWDIVLDNRKRRMSPIAACDDVRAFLKKKGLGPGF